MYIFKKYPFTYYVKTYFLNCLWGENSAVIVTYKILESCNLIDTETKKQ